MMKHINKLLKLTGSALFASGILRRLSKRAKSIGYANLAEKLKKNARY